MNGTLTTVILSLSSKYFPTNLKQLKPKQTVQNQPVYDKKYIIQWIKIAKVIRVQWFIVFLSAGQYLLVVS